MGVRGLEGIRDSVALRLRRRAFRACLNAKVIPAEPPADEENAAQSEGNRDWDYQTKQASIRYLQAPSLKSNESKEDTARNPNNRKESQEGTVCKPIKISATEKNMRLFLALRPVVREVGLVRSICNTCCLMQWKGKAQTQLELFASSISNALCLATCKLPFLLSLSFDPQLPPLIAIALEDESQAIRAGEQS